MCFSASASFTASGGLVLAGLATHRYRSVATHQRPLAAIPYLFAVQQFSEGLVWLGVSGTIPGDLQRAAIFIFSFFAFVLWPIYIPYAAACLEQHPARRRFLTALCGVGLALSVYYLWCFTVFSSLMLDVLCQSQTCGSLAYQFRVPYLASAVNYVYLALASLPFFLQRNPRIRWGVGLPIFFSFPLTLSFSVPDTFPSTWCFFAAVASLSIYCALLKKPGLHRAAG